MIRYKITNDVVVEIPPSWQGLPNQEIIQNMHIRYMTSRKMERQRWLQKLKRLEQLGVVHKINDIYQLIEKE